MVPAQRLIGTCDLVFVTLDTLRFDVARDCLENGRTPELARILPLTGWERRHSPASFTYAAHHAFFAGFLPTPAADPRAPRLFAAAFAGSETTAPDTFTFDEPHLPAALSVLGYRTTCIGGVGFFNKQTALGSVLPAMFTESYWSPKLGVTSSSSTELQVDLALQCAARMKPGERWFLFLNISAIHQPNCIFSEHEKSDSVSTMADALAYVDQHLGRLFRKLRKRAPLLAVLTSDHGTAYGEGGYTGHRLAHPTVLEVPYAQVLLEQEP